MIYFDTPSSGLFSEASKEAVDRFNTEMLVNPSKVSEWFRNDRLPVLRNLLSQFLNASISDIALIPNTSFGLNSILASLKNIQSVLLYEKEYLGLTMPFEIGDYSIHSFKDIDGYHWDNSSIKKKLLDNKVELFVFSSVQWLTGYIADVSDLCAFCREHGIITIDDYSQSMGSLKFSFNDSDMDIALFSNYKWMNAGFGSGVMCMKSEFLKQNKPVLAGYNSAAPLFDFDNFKPNIRCYEPGHLNLHAFSALIPSLEHKLDLGIEQIEAKNISLSKSFIDGAQNIGFEIVGDKLNRSSIVLLKNKTDLKNHLDQHEVACQERGAGIRFGFHYHNTIEEVNDCLEILSKFNPTL